MRSESSDEPQTPGDEGDEDDDDRQITWTSQNFLELRIEFANDRSMKKALEILQRMMEIDVEQVDDNAWLECKELIAVLLNAIPVTTLLETQQIMLLTALETCPPHVVTALADHLIAHQDVAIPLLNNVAQAVAVAFARRINHSDTYEKLALLLAPVASNPQLIQELQHQLSTTKSAEHRFKLYQGHYAAALAPLLQRLVDELSADDMLNALAAMDLLSDMAIASTIGAKIVNECGAPQKVYQLLQSSAVAPDGGFIHLSCMKFFGTLGRQYPETLDDFPLFVSAVFHFNLLDASQRMLAFDTLAQIAYNTEAKQSLQKMLGTDGISRAMEAFAVAISSGPVELRTRHLDALAILFEKGENELLKEWFKYMGVPMPSLLLNLVQKPFPDLRMASLRAFGSLLCHPFGIETFLETSGFLDWLLNRSTEQEWEASCLKMDIIRSMIASESPLIDAPLKLRLKAYFVTSSADPSVEVVL
ncbi:hypothetical protein KIN20_017924 [Parelaphostrongylus tenuis]|uniref:26S proteasome non-ATPase regulatory subunit 5 n=1 Tax=Parelaphostrongylus tenuis TaxID=148309 RepID=A0AAD5QR48_PARTN|nr:hypothetical protein KIN20_017924 [Parelaphostrongylus tenuis]